MLEVQHYCKPFGKKRDNQNSNSLEFFFSWSFETFLVLSAAAASALSPNQPFCLEKCIFVHSASYHHIQLNFYWSGVIQRTHIMTVLSSSGFAPKIKLSFRRFAIFWCLVIRTSPGRCRCPALGLVLLLNPRNSL